MYLKLKDLQNVFLSCLKRKGHGELGARSKMGINPVASGKPRKSGAALITKQI
jgi:hypothetical protein